MDRGQNWIRSQAEFPDLPYAAHGGHVVFGDRNTALPSAFYSTLTIGPTRYKYQARLTAEGQAQMAAQTPAFFEWCRERVRMAILQPLSEESKLDLGL